jgi:hypothetical protein
MQAQSRVGYIITMPRDARVLTRDDVIDFHVSKRGWVLHPCREVRGALAAHQIPLGKFIITKQLTKKLEEYPDAKNQPHVQVALRRRAAGKTDGIRPVSGQLYMQTLLCWQGWQTG